jgi:hypothetical protein
MATMSKPDLQIVTDDYVAGVEASLKSSGGGGTFDGMDARVTALEKRFDRFEQKLDGLVKDTAEMKGRISAMPTTWQLMGMILAIMGASFAIIRFGLAGI